MVNVLSVLEKNAYLLFQGTYSVTVNSRLVDDIVISAVHLMIFLLSSNIS